MMDEHEQESRMVDAMNAQADRKQVAALADAIEEAVLARLAGFPWRRSLGQISRACRLAARRFHDEAGKTPSH